MQHVERWRDRTGKVRLYFRIGKGSRTPLRGPEGSPAFWEDYHAALKKHTGAGVGKADTIRWLCEQYYRSAAYKQLKPRTRHVRRQILDRFCEERGDRPFKGIEPKHLRAIRDQMAERPEAANGLTKALRQVFKYAVQYGHMQGNPGNEVEWLRPTNRDGHLPWSDRHIRLFVERHPVGTKAFLALALFLFTAQRLGDVAKMGRQHETDGGLEFTQEKTGARLWIPIFPELRVILDASPTGDMTYLVTEFGKPFTSAGFGNWFRRRCREAGITDRSAHGLRKTALTRQAERGVSEHGLMALGGHRTSKEVNRYTREARQKILAKGIGVEWGQEGNDLAQTLGLISPNSGKDKGNSAS